MNRIVKRIPCLLFVGFSLLAQGPTGVRIVDGSSAERITAASGKKFDSGMIAITTGGVTFASITTTVQVIHCNTNSTASTLTITDNSGSPVTYFNAVSITANSVVIGNYGLTGMTYNSGIIITAGTSSALTCRVTGVQ